MEQLFKYAASAVLIIVLVRVIFSYTGMVGVLKASRKDWEKYRNYHRARLPVFRTAQGYSLRLPGRMDIRFQKAEGSRVGLLLFGRPGAPSRRLSLALPMKGPEGWYGDLDLSEVSIPIVIHVLGVENGYIVYTTERA